METLSAIRSVTASSVYISDDSENVDGYWCEGEPANVQVERTDTDEIRLGVQIRGNSSDDVTVFLGRSEAIRLVLALAGAVGDR